MEFIVIRKRQIKLSMDKAIEILTKIAEGCIKTDTIFPVHNFNDRIFRLPKEISDTLERLPNPNEWKDGGTYKINFLRPNAFELNTTITLEEETWTAKEIIDIAIEIVFQKFSYNKFYQDHQFWGIDGENLIKFIEVIKTYWEKENELDNG